MDLLNYVHVCSTSTVHVWFIGGGGAANKEVVYSGNTHTDGTTPSFAAPLLCKTTQ